MKKLGLIAVAIVILFGLQKAYESFQTLRGMEISGLEVYGDEGKSGNFTSLVKGVTATKLKRRGARFTNLPGPKLEIRVARVYLSPRGVPGLSLNITYDTNPYDGITPEAKRASITLGNKEDYVLARAVAAEAYEHLLELKRTGNK